MTTLYSRFSAEDAKAIMTAVNQGIDAHLEACFVPDRGDKYEWMTLGEMEAHVSKESLPVLVRRLGELGQYKLAAKLIREDSLDEFTLAYIQAALWTSIDNDDDPMDANYTVADVSMDTLAEITKECNAFKTGNAADIEAGLGYGQAGHDFWMTRTGQGVGFWDGDWPEEIGERLTADSKKYGSRYLYMGDDGLIYGG